MDETIVFGLTIGICQVVYCTAELNNNNKDKNATYIDKMYQSR